MLFFDDDMLTDDIAGDDGSDFESDNSFQHNDGSIGNLNHDLHPHDLNESTWEGNQFEHDQFDGHHFLADNHDPHQFDDIDITEDHTGLHQNIEGSDIVSLGLNDPNIPVLDTNYDTTHFINNIISLHNGQMPGTGELINVSGPVTWYDPTKLDWAQGDNMMNMQGDCGLVSTMNVARMAGINISEDDICKIAAINNHCEFDPDHPDLSGGTDSASRQDLLQDLNISCHIVDHPDINTIADQVSSNHGVMIGINAGELWHEDKGFLQILKEGVFGRNSDHVITVTGVCRDPYDDHIKGFVVCDSGRRQLSDSVRVIDPDEMKHILDTNTSSAIITDYSLHVLDYFNNHPQPNQN